MENQKFEKLISLSTKIDAFINKIGRFHIWLVGIMTIISAYNAITRYLGKYLGLDLSSNAFIETQWYLFSLIFLLGGSYAFLHNAHVKIDILYNRFSDEVKTKINLFGTLFFLMPFSLLMIVVSIPSVVNSWKVLEMSPDPGGLPRFPLKTFVPISFVLLLLQGISYFIKNYIHLKTHKEFPEDRPITEKSI
ncbi:MAG: TRAP transporter small permease subunit [Leptospiraceae bacterium]|nr:TRAP transporter small permease subunit [Leptospiraceae bacterium]MDW7975904.1 TRAP transporter small permease subunit [Leptospiraceae bacterium]